MIDLNVLRAKIIESTVRAVNATLYVGEERALKDVPVRKAFRGGRQTVRFKTANEIEADRDLRSRLGLAPEILATPEALAKVRSAGLNPQRAILRGGKEFGFARTISHPARGNRRNKAGLTRADRGLVENRRNRANDFMPFGEDIRVLATGTERNRLADQGAERYLTGQGRYELRTGRAIHQRRIAISADVNARTGEVKEIHYQDVGPARLGGGLRSTVRIVKARADQYPMIEGWLLAGDREHDYAKYQELGTRHNAAHPFLRPRLPEWREELPTQLRRSLGRAGR